MMAVTVFGGYAFGVDQLVLTQGDGTSPPQVVAASGSDDHVTVTFSADMGFDEASGALNRDHYRIVDTNSGQRLYVRHTRLLSSVQVELIVAEPFPHNPTIYNLTVIRARDVYGQSIDPLNNQASFVAQNTILPDIDKIHGFFGLEAGFQSDQASGLSPDIDAPVLQNQNPLPGAIDVPVDSNIVLELTDIGVGLDPAPVVLKVNGAFAWTDQTVQLGFSVTVTTVPNGLRYEIDPDANLPDGATQTVDIVASDLAPLPNGLDTSYTFDTAILDVLAPTLQSLSPTPGAVNVSLTAPIILEIVDDKTGVNVNATVITVAGGVAWQADGPQAGFTGSKVTIAGGYRYTISPDSPLSPNTVIDVAVVASDQAIPTANVLNTSYAFTSEDVQFPPQLVDVVPLPGAIDVPESTNIALSVVDPNFDLSPSSVRITVGGVLTWANDGQQPGFSVQKTAIPTGFRYEIDPDAPFAPEALVSVDVFAQDTKATPNVLSQSHTFSVRDEAAGGALLNPSFEIAGVNAGEAESWTLITTASAVQIASYDLLSPQSREDFEHEWQNNESFAFGFDGVTFSLAQYDPVAEAVEDFEEGWLGNEVFILGLTDGVNALFASYDLGTAQNVEDFEEQWQNNHSYFFDFDALQSTPAAFDEALVAEDVEDFEELWRSNETYAFDFSGVTATAVTYDEAGTAEPIEDFEELWPTLVMTTL